MGSLDKAKSVLMGVAFEKSQNQATSDALIDELHKLWALIYQDVAFVPGDSNDILRIAATLYSQENVNRALLSSEESIRSLRDFCDTPNKTTTASTWLKDVASKMVKVRNECTWVPIASISHARALAISIMLSDTLNDEERDRALDQLERVTFRIYGLFNKDSRTKAPEYINLAMKIRYKHEDCQTFSSVMEKLRQLGQDFPIGEAIAEYFGESNYDRTEYCRYVLWRYEEYLAEKQDAKVNQELRNKIWSEWASASDTIEHILPQAHEKSMGWRVFPDAKARKNVDKIANLILLPPGLNSEAGKKAFSDKILIYKRAEGLRSIKELLKLNVWDDKAFDARQKKLKDFVSEAFSDM